MIQSVALYIWYLHHWFRPRQERALRRGNKLQDDLARFLSMCSAAGRETISALVLMCCRWRCPASSLSTEVLHVGSPEKVRQRYSHHCFQPCREPPRRRKISCRMIWQGVGAKAALQAQYQQPASCLRLCSTHTFPEAGGMSDGDGCVTVYGSDITTTTV